MLRSLLLPTLLAASIAAAQAPGTRTLVDCHNCYPYNGEWSDRIDRALATGLPVAIEQDLTWYVPADGGPGRVVDSHEKKLSGTEPTLEHYFFDRIRPLVEQAMKDPDHSKWPLITLNLDFKTEQPELLRAVWKILEAHQDWLQYAVKPADAATVTPMVAAGPVLVLTGRSDLQQKIFFDDRPVGSHLMLFGAVHSDDKARTSPPEVVMKETATAYRRWWNNPWNLIEAKGQAKAGEWTPALAGERLKSFAKLAHEKGLWLRFYTLDGDTAEGMEKNGWFANYSFGSVEQARKRWAAATFAGVDFIASDQMEELSKVIYLLKNSRALHSTKVDEQGYTPQIRKLPPGDPQVNYK